MLKWPIVAYDRHGNKVFFKHSTGVILKSLPPHFSTKDSPSLFGNFQCLLCKVVLSLKNLSKSLSTLGSSNGLGSRVLLGIIFLVLVVTSQLRVSLRVASITSGASPILFHSILPCTGVVHAAPNFALSQRHYGSSQCTAPRHVMTLELTAPRRVRVVDRKIAGVEKSKGIEDRKRNQHLF